MLIDSHCHFDDRRFDLDRQEAWQRAQDAGVKAQIIPAVTAADWPRVKQTCANFPGLYPAYGLHPMFCSEHQNEDLVSLREWIEQEQPVAVGECGLDFYIKDPDKERQLELFIAQLGIARECNLPVIIHARKAVEEIIISLDKFPELRGVLHSYSGSLQQANRLIEMGFIMSFGGPITNPRSSRLRQLVSELPLDSIMLESDSPDQPDIEHQGQRNEPSYLPLILQQMSEIREEPIEVIAAQTTANAQQLFGIES
jgi:TatD DNase family protein